jgi:putative Holliday junction resolvase
MGTLLSLDVGTKRIGVATAETTLPIAVPLETIEVNGGEVVAIKKIVTERGVEAIVVGYPRNQKGEATEQTAIVERFVQGLGDIARIIYQDESLTSVIAEDRLKASGKPYQKGDIDALAATIILQDYLEVNYGA